jgi:hypothetical protein
LFAHQFELCRTEILDLEFHSVNLSSEDKHGDEVSLGADVFADGTSIRSK